MSTTTPNLGLFKYNTSTDGKEVFSITTALNNNWDILDERCGSNRNIGEIVASTIPLTDAGLHLLDGSLLQYGSYQAFIDYIADLYDSGDYTAIFDTEANWQSAVTTNGVCGKFVYNSTNNTVRLPRITGFIEGGNVSEVGSFLAQVVKLPNITGSFAPLFGPINSTEATTSVTGAFYQSSSAGSNNSYGASYYARSSKTLGFQASRSSSVYNGNGSDTKIHPQSIKVLYYIVIATTTKTDIQVDIDEIATDLNSKADKTAVDGQWKPLQVTLASNVTYPTSSNLEYDVSSYLPDNVYNYELLLSAYANTGATSGNYIYVTVLSDIITSPIYLCGNRTRTASNVLCAGTGILPVGSNRKVLVTYSSSVVGNFYLYLRGYRRIGTNA